MREKTNGYLDRYDRFMERKIVLEQRRDAVQVAAFSADQPREQASQKEARRTNSEQFVSNTVYIQHTVSLS